MPEKSPRASSAPDPRRLPQIVKKGELEAQRGGRQAGAGQRKKRNPIEDLKREVAIMRTLRHKNITALQEVVDDPSGNKVGGLQGVLRPYRRLALAWSWVEERRVKQVQQPGRLSGCQRLT